jgi:hypothetical protein
MQIISEREYIETISFSHEFRFREGGGGFAFDCDENGNVTFDNHRAAMNYFMCKNGAHDVIDRGIHRYENGWNAQPSASATAGRRSASTVLPIPATVAQTTT